MTETMAPSRTDAQAPVPAVEIEGLCRSFGTVKALDNVNLTIRKGELVSLLGASGSGKSTLLRQIAGFDTPTSGTIRLGGRDVTRLSPAQRDIGMVFQNYALFPHLSVRKNIEYGLKMRGWDAARRQARAAEMLGRMRLADFGDRLPAELSGGQQQRVAIARSLAFSPSLLLMDEPLGALDKALKEDMLEEIRRVHQEFGTTIVYVTHDREEALVLSDRIALMDQAQLKICAPVEDLYLRPPTAFAASFISGSCVLEPSAELQLTPADGGVAATITGSPTVLAGTGNTGSLDGFGLAVRPSGFSVDAAGAPGAFTAEVIESVFLGDQVRIIARLQAFDLRVKALVDLAAAPQLLPGQTIGLRPRPDAMSVVSL